MSRQVKCEIIYQQILVLSEWNGRMAVRVLRGLAFRHDIHLLRIERKVSYVAFRSCGSG